MQKWEYMWIYVVEEQGKLTYICERRPAGCSDVCRGVERGRKRRLGTGHCDPTGGHPRSRARLRTVLFEATDDRVGVLNSVDFI